MTEVDDRGAVDVSAESSTAVQCGGLGGDEAGVGCPDADQPVALGSGLPVGAELGWVAGLVGGQ
ncbi:hypothetical protein [Amycolatopsis sp. CA-126428]|uniref:hypothetical protein n=1 Tax=Amycolatopsis sp. CA-126428 TaxID=2073158 RepID=UPI001E3F9FDC|nr:hypothetical protein [Amycolatopsis sp. CA-126428]